MNTSSLPKKNYWPYVAWAVASFFYFFQYILRVLPGATLPHILKIFEINPAQFGQFSGVYYIGYALLHLPVGIMLDRYGSRKVITFSILLTVTGLLPLAYSHHWTLALIGRLLTGMGSCGAALSMINIIRLNFSDKHYTRMLSFSITIGLLGGIYGGTPLHYLIDRLGFTLVVKSFFFLGVGIALLSYLAIPEEKRVGAEAIQASLIEIFTSKKLLLACLFSGLMVGPLEGFADAWGKPYLAIKFGLLEHDASTLVSCIFLGMCLGSPWLGYIADRVGYFKTIIFSGFFMLAVFTSLLLGYLNHHMTAAAFFLTGICSAYQILVLYVVTKLTSQKAAGLTTAVTNMIVMAFGYGFHSAIGKLIYWKGGFNSLAAFSFGLSTIPIGLLVGSLGFLLLAKWQEKEPSDRQATPADRTAG